MLRRVEERHVYVLYAFPRLDSEPGLYVKAMSASGLGLPGAEVAAFPVMKPIQHAGLMGPSAELAPGPGHTQGSRGARHGEGAGHLSLCLPDFANHPNNFLSRSPILAGGREV